MSHLLAGRGTHSGPRSQTLPVLLSIDLQQPPPPSCIIQPDGGTHLANPSGGLWVGNEKMPGTLLSSLQSIGSVERVI